VATRVALDVALILLGGTLLGSVAFNALAYLGAARHRRHHPPACPEDDEDVPAAARALAWIGAFTIECGVTALLTLTVPLSFRRVRVRAVADGDPRRPVVLLHGYAQHTANFLWLLRRLRRDGWLHLYSVRHTALGGDIERSAARLGVALDRIRRESGADAVDVVAHSMGGLVARALLAARGASSGIARLITLGTPHQGTLAFTRVAAGPMVAQMRPGSPLLRDLAAADGGVEAAECISIYTADDAIVVPPSAAYWPGALNIEVRGLGHMSLLFSRRVYELVRENLAVPSRATGAGLSA
jgi:triacylglycerol esterase/lipase EstA (alpha/beta hydrolase family)